MAHARSMRKLELSKAYQNLLLSSFIIAEYKCSPQSILLSSAYLYLVTDRGSMLKHKIENILVRLVETRLAQMFFCPVPS